MKLDSQEISEQLSTKSEELKRVQEAITAKEAEVEDQKKIFSKAYVQDSQSEETATAQRALSDSNSELDALRDAEAILNGELDDLSKKLSLSELYEGEGKRFLESMETSEQAHAKIKELLGTLERDLSAFSGLVQTLTRKQNTAASGFKSIVEVLPDHYSLRSFLQGELIQAEEGPDKAEIISETRIAMGRLAEIECEKIETGFLRFQDSVATASQWRIHIIAHNPLDSRRAFAPLLPSQKKKFKSAKTTTVKTISQRDKQEIIRRNPDAWSDEEKRKAGIVEKRQERINVGAHFYQ